MAGKKKPPAPTADAAPRDPLDFAGGTRSVTLNLPVALWNALDELAPSRGKNKLIIQLLVSHLSKYGSWPPKSG